MATQDEAADLSQFDSLAAYAARLGRWRWFEQRCFEVVGGWVTTTHEAPAKIFFATYSQHQAWHAGVWADRFPQGYGHDVDAATRPGHDGLVRYFDELASIDATSTRMAALCRSLSPAAIAGYRAWQAALSEATRGPLARWLERIVADELADWQEGLGHLSQLLVDAPAIGAASERQGVLDSLLSEPGGGPAIR